MRFTNVEQEANIFVTHRVFSWLENSTESTASLVFSSPVARIHQGGGF
jgi:hypothetical protein